MAEIVAQKYLFNCAICEKQLDESCKMLPCQHTYCKACLNSMYEQENMLRCLQCEKIFFTSNLSNPVDSLITNFTLLNVIKSMTRSSPNLRNETVKLQDATDSNLSEEFNEMYFNQKSHDGGIFGRENRNILEKMKSKQTIIEAHENVTQHKQDVLSGKNEFAEAMLRLPKLEALMKRSNMSEITGKSNSSENSKPAPIKAEENNDLKKRSLILPDARDYENYIQSGKKMSLSNDQKNVNRKQIGEKIHETAYQFPTSSNDGHQDEKGRYDGSSYDPNRGKSYRGFYSHRGRGGRGEYNSDFQRKSYDNRGKFDTVYLPKAPYISKEDAQMLQIDVEKPFETPFILLGKSEGVPVCQTVQRWVDIYAFEEKYTECVLIRY